MISLRVMLNRLPWSILLILCATLGLAPFAPEPHVWEKLKMLFTGQLGRLVDIFDLLFHGAPWVLLLLKGLVGNGSPSS
ncbi:RND transporter [Marivita sp. S0852]|uniref:RND transporter n=1 Tax=Marivita sp. S0852 TaxID=3373893 RepID=UPI003982C880